MFYSVVFVYLLYFGLRSNYYCELLSQFSQQHPCADLTLCKNVCVREDREQEGAEKGFPLTEPYSNLNSLSVKCECVFYFLANTLLCCVYLFVCLSAHVYV